MGKSIRILIDFSLTVKAVTLIFISGRGSAISSAKPEVLSDFINLTQVHNFTVSAQDIFAFRRLSLFTVSFLQEFCKY